MSEAVFHAIFNWYNAIVVILGGVIAVWFSLGYRKTKSRPLLTSLPGIFTSLGLLGTFLSIVISLGDIKASDFSMNDQSASEASLVKNVTPSEITEDALDMENGVREAVGMSKQTPSNTDKTIEIISGLVPAFTSSIIGLIMAFLATVVTKWIFSKEDVLIDGKTNKTTPEENLYNIYLLLTQQKDNVEEYNQQLKKNIAEQNKILEQYLKSFEDKLNGIFGHIQSSITDQVDSIGAEQMERAEQMLTQISESLATVTKEILTSQKSSVEGLVNETNLQLKDMASSIASQYALIQKNANDNIASMTALKEQYATANEDLLQQTIKLNQKATDDMRDSLNSFVSDISASVNSECAQLHASIESNVQALDKAYTFIKDRIAQITSDYDQASFAYRDAVSVAHRQNESAENTIRKANESLELLAETNAKIGNLLDAFKDRQDNIESLVSHISEISCAIEALQNIELQLKRINK